MIVLLTPIYLAGTIIEEKENRTLEMLFQTQVTDREILLGKYGARVVHLLSLSLLSLPMLTIITLWGGIDLELLAFHFTCSLLLIFLIGSTSLWASVLANNILEALLLSYVLMLPLAYISGAAIVVVEDLERLGKFPCLIQGLWMLTPIAIVCLAGTYIVYRLSLREFHKLRDLNWLKRIDPSPQAWKRKRPKPATPRNVQMAARSVPDHALFWKEQCYAIVEFPVFFLWTGFACACVLCSISLYWHAGGVRVKPWDLEGLRVFYFTGYVSLTGLVLFISVLETTATVARERERNTLDALLLLPVERWEILCVKAIGPWASNRVMVGMMLALPIMAVMAGIVSLRAGLMYMLLPWPSLFFLNALGLLLSVIHRRVVTAYVALVVTLLLVFLGHLLRFRDFALIVEGIINLTDIVDRPVERLDEKSLRSAVQLIVLQQSLFLLSAFLCVGLAFWLFGRKTSEACARVG